MAGNGLDLIGTSFKQWADLVASAGVFGWPWAMCMD